MGSTSHKTEFLEKKDKVGFMSVLSAQDEAGPRLGHEGLLAETNSTEWRFSSLLTTPRQIKSRLLFTSKNQCKPPGGMVFETACEENLLSKPELARDESVLFGGEGGGGEEGVV